MWQIGCLFLGLTLTTTSTALATSGEYENRLQFSKRLSKLSPSKDGRGMALDLLGKPTVKVDVQIGSYSEAWFYCSDRAGKFPDRGSVYFDRNGYVSKVFGANAPSPSVSRLGVSLPKWLSKISESSGLYSQSFDSLKVVELCRQLLSIPFSEAICILEEYQRIRPVVEADGFGSNLSTTSSMDGNDGRLGVILLTLLSADPQLKRKVYPDESCLYYETSYFKGGIPPGQLLMSRGWPVILPIGHIPNNGMTYEGSMLDYAKQRGSFAYTPPLQRAPTMRDYDELSQMMDRVCISHIAVAQYKKSFLKQLGLNRSLNGRS